MASIVLLRSFLYHLDKLRILPNDSTESFNRIIERSLLVFQFSLVDRFKYDQTLQAAGDHGHLSVQTD